MKRLPLWVKLFLVLAVLAAGCVALAFVPTDDVAYAPAAPIDLDGKIKVDGALIEPLQGRIYLVGVTERRINLLQRGMLDIADSSIDFAKAPAGANPTGGPTEGDIQSMARAKEFAAAVAYDLADGAGTVQWSGKGATVASVAADGPAAGKLFPGDSISLINGVAYDNAVDVMHTLNGLAPGSKVRLFVRRAGQAITAELVTAPAVANDPMRKSRIGVSIDTIDLQVTLPQKVTIDSGVVVGPSAGLAFALTLYDAFDTDVDLLRGRHVVVTGALTPDGQVAPVGRVRQKAIAAQRAGRDVLVVPAANVAAAKEAVKDTCSGEDRCITVVGVTSVQDAIAVLRGS